MLNYIMGRLARMIPQVFLISILAFIIIQLPPGDFLTEEINRLQSSGVTMDPGQVQKLSNLYGLDKPLYVQYFKWIGNIVTKLDFGYSFNWQRPVNDILLSRMGMTFFIAFLAFVVSWGLAIPVGIYVAVKQYSFADYFFTFIGFVGLATPGFLLALVLMYISYAVFHIRVGGLYSPEFETQPMSWAKFMNLLGHLWLPVLILAIAGMANIIRTLRATMLDELRKQYVAVARSKGLSEFQVIMQYPVRIAINPILSQTTYLLAWLFSGGTVVEIVLNLNTAGPVLWRALLQQDMYTAGAYIFILGVLYSLGSLLSDLLLAAIDPRIRFGSMEAA
jgi:peptide/nickel transport system permease protein